MGAGSTDSVKLPNHRCSVCGEEWPTTGSHLCKPQSTDYVKPRPRLLDLCSGAGGAAMGYHRAGFEVVGVDLAPQPRFPFEFHQADALEVLATWDLSSFAAIHASFPCQRWTPFRHLHPDREHPDLVTPGRPLLQASRRPFTIENVEGAPLENAVMLCGSMFDPPLDLRRHRLFETNWPLRLTDWPCRHKLWAPRFPPEDRRMTRMSRVVGVYGGGRYKGSDAIRQRAMGIDWMTREELAQAIPPVYTEWIGSQLLLHLDRAEAA